MQFLHVIPLALVMIAGPQILTPVFLATGESSRPNSLAYVAGATISITLVVSSAYVLGSGLLVGRATNTTFSAVLLVVLIGLMGNSYRTRHEAEIPQWMGKLQSASPRMSFRLGFLLLGFFPTDLITSVTVGSYLAETGSPWLYAVPFILCTLLMIGLPGLLVATIGERAETLLPVIRDWMESNSWVVSELVLLIFIGISLSNLLG